MSALLDMLSAVLAWLMAVAMVHFGAIDPLGLDTPPAPAQTAQSHSESPVAKDVPPPAAPAGDDDHAPRRRT